MFGSLHEMSENEADVFLISESLRARQTLITLVPDRTAPILYKDLWPQILARHVVRRTGVNQLAAQLRKDDFLEFPDWEPRKRIPQPDYRVYRKEISDKRDGNGISTK
jgi:hypothetical protein